MQSDKNRTQIENYFHISLKCFWNNIDFFNASRTVLFVIAWHEYCLFLVCRFFLTRILNCVILPFGVKLDFSILLNFLQKTSFPNFTAEW